MECCGVKCGDVPCEEGWVMPSVASHGFLGLTVELREVTNNEKEHTTLSCTPSGGRLTPPFMCLCTHYTCEGPSVCKVYGFYHWMPWSKHRRSCLVTSQTVFVSFLPLFFSLKKKWHGSVCLLHSVTCLFARAIVPRLSTCKTCGSVTYSWLPISFRKFWSHSSISFSTWHIERYLASVLDDAVNFCFLLLYKKNSTPASMKMYTH